MKTTAQTSKFDLQFTTWREAFALHIAQTYENKETAALAMQHINVFSKWYEAEFSQLFNPAELVNYHFKLYRTHSLNQAKVMAATWNSRLWALTIFCEWIGSPELLEGVTGKNHTSISERNRSLTAKERHDLNVICQQDIRGYATYFDYYNAVRDYAMVAVMLEAGLRVAECAALNVTDIVIGERSGHVLVRGGKGGKERKVPLRTGDKYTVRTALKAWLEVRGETNSSALWLGKETERLSDRTIQRIVKSIAARIGAPDITCHCLRYEFAKELQRNSMDITDISRLLGHNSIEVTKRYLRSSLADLQSAMEGK